MRTLRIFISSPGDVSEERQRARAVIERVERRFLGKVRLVPVVWEDAPLRATASFQAGIDQQLPLDQIDLVLFLLWGVLGTPLGEGYRDGERERTGTEWEFEQARASFALKRAPDLLVYRRMAEPLLPSLQRDPAGFEAATRKFKAVGAFFDRWFADQGAGQQARLTYVTPQGFEDRFERNLRLWVAQRLSAPSETGPAWEGSPFRGLLAFEAKHASVFFGRSRATYEALAALQTQANQGAAFLLILGASGAGKSSLARAGLLPQITRPSDIMPEAPEGFVVQAVMTPGEGSSPFESLVAALAQQDALGLGQGGSEARAERARAFRESASAVVAYVRERLGERAHVEQQRQRVAEPTVGRLLLLVDQMEELFTREGVTNEDRLAFGRVLAALATSGVAWVVATLRNDFYGRLSDLPGLLALKGETGQVDLLAPSTTEIAEMVRGPATAAHLTYDTHPTTGRGLAEELIEAAGQASGALPLLQFTLEALYRTRKGTRLTWEAYEALGGLKGALRSRAEEAFAGVDVEARAALPALVRSLVEVQESEEGAVSRRRPHLATLRRSPEVGRLVDALLEARLLEADKDLGGEAVVGVAHEALLTSWKRFADSVAADREILQIRHRIQGEAAYWESRGHDATLLLPEGLGLRDAERLMAARLLDLEERTRRFMEASLAAARERAAAARKAERQRRIVRVSLTTALLLAALGTWLGLGWASQAALARHINTARARLASGDLKGAADALGAAKERDEAHADVRLLDGDLRAAQAARERGQKEEAARTTATAERERAGAKEQAISALGAEIKVLVAELAQEESSVFSAYAPTERRAAFHAKRQRSEHLRVEMDRRVAEAREALEVASRAESLLGGNSQATTTAQAEHFMARWREAVAAGDELRAARAREQVEALSSERYRQELEGLGTLRLEIDPPEAEVFLFRYESYETVRTDRAVVPRLVPVPCGGVGRCPSDVWAPYFFPGDPCLVVTGVEQRSVADGQLAPGDLVIRINDLPCDEGLFVTEVVPDGPAARAGVQPFDRILSIDGHALEVESDWPQASAAQVPGQPPYRVLLQQGAERSVLEAPRAKPLEESLGLAIGVAAPGLLVRIAAPAGGCRLTCLRVGQPFTVDVPPGRVSGITAERTACPLLCVPGTNAWSATAGSMPVDPGSYLLFARAPGRESQRYPVAVPRAGEVRVRMRLHAVGTTPPGFVYVPAGKFEVGGDPEAHHPLRHESVEMDQRPDLRDGFWIARHEVTVGEWFRFLNDAGTRGVIADAVQPRYIPRDPSSPGGYVSPTGDGRYVEHVDGRLSISSVSWDDITDDAGFLAWRNRQADAARWRFSLPTDLEWERAARGADRRIYPWGNVFDFSLAASGYARPYRSSGLAPGALVAGESPFGVQDLAGLRWEWTASEFSPGSGRYALRGASWDDTLPAYFRVSSRLSRRPDHVSPYFGLRLVARPR